MGVFERERVNENENENVDKRRSGKREHAHTSDTVARRA